MPRLVLASASPRRRDLLEEAGYDVVCAPSHAEELECDHLPPGELALENARRKAAVIAPDFSADIVLSADTVVALDGVFYGKPKDLEDALRILNELNGRTHEVVTGVVLIPNGRTPREFFVSSAVTFRQLSEPELIAYLASIQPLDKAGAYAAQEDNGRIIAQIEGSMTNVVGLPMERLKQELDALGV